MRAQRDPQGWGGGRRKEIKRPTRHRHFPPTKARSSKRKGGARKMEGPGRRPGVCKSRIAYAGRAKSTHDLASPHRPPATVGWVLLPTDRWSSTRPAPVNVEASGVLSSPSHAPPVQSHSWPWPRRPVATCRALANFNRTRKAGTANTTSGFWSETDGLMLTSGWPRLKPDESKANKNAHFFILNFK
jgi:hypothetical protein